LPITAAQSSPRFFNSCSGTSAISQPLIADGAPEALYLQLGSLVAEMPDLAHGPKSFNKLAERAHTSLLRLPQEAGVEKIDAYEAMWVTAVKLA
jgi:hypothetical protein